MLGWAESRDNLVAKELWSKGGQVVTALAWPEFEYWRQQFVVDFRPCTEKIFSGCLGFPSCQKWIFPNSNSILMGEQRITSWVSHLWIVIYSFIHSFIWLFVYLFISVFSIQSFLKFTGYANVPPNPRPRDLLAINSCSHRLLFRFCIVADEEPVATTSMPTSTGAKSIGTNLRAENQGPAVGSPQTPPTLNAPSTRYVRCKE